MAIPPQSKEWKPPLLSTLRKDQIPVDIFNKFKMELGEVNSHLCLVDAAIQDFARSSRQSPDSTAFLRQRTREHGHRNLSIDILNLEFSMRLAYTAQIALLLSRLEQLCKVLRKHSLIDTRLSELMEGDFLRRTLWLVAVSLKCEKIPTPIQDAEAYKYVAPLDLAVFDYYRIMRNSELHAVADADDNLTEVYSKIDVKRCKTELGYVPILHGEVNFRDVLMVSKCCQRIAHNLCRSIVDPKRDILPELKRRFGSHSADRRRNAAKSMMTQSYLLDIADAEVILYDLAW